MALLILFEVFNQSFGGLIKQIEYKLSPKAEALLNTQVEQYGDKLVYDNNSDSYEYNKDYKSAYTDVAGQVSGPKITANFPANPELGTEIKDPKYGVKVKIVPKFKLATPKKVSNRLYYPIIGKDAIKVISLAASGYKEDIVFEKFSSQEVNFDYELSLPEGVEARLESDGSIGIYGSNNTALLGDVSASSESDSTLLAKARQNSNKTKLLFTIPAPFIKQSGLRPVYSNVRYKLEGNQLTVNATSMDAMVYPLSIDPSIYVETAAKLMRGNNETNIDFDVDNELIQKSQTTGARIDAWSGNLDMTEGTWGQGTTAAGGYVYRTGGETGLYTKPSIVDQEASAQSSNSTSFVMNMPDTRPEGDLYIALMCHDGTGAITPPSGGGWTEYADTREHAAYYKVGTDAGGGSEASSYTWTGSSEEWYGVIMRVTGFNASDPVSGTPGTGSSASDAVPTLPATTPDASATLVISSTGVDDDIPDDTSWLPYGYTIIASGNSNSSTPTDTNDCGFAAASLDTPPTNGVSTGTTDLVSSSLLDTYGASTIAINPSGSPSRPQVEDSIETLQNSNSTSFTMDMPTTRPAGDLYIAVMCYDGDSGDGTGGSNSGNTISTPSGWTKYANRNGHAAYYKIGTDAGGGNEAASYTFSGNSEKWGGVIMRITNFDSSDPISGTPGVGHSNSASPTPVFPAVTPDTDNTLIIRAVGADNDEPSATGWVPSGHTKIASGGPTGTQDCAYMTASLDASPASGVSTGTATMGDTSVQDTYGASSIAINAVPSSTPTPSTRASLNWAQFDPATSQITSPNPGTGVCDGWCTDPTYDLPAGRKAHAMVAYNGYLYVIGGLDSGGNRVSTIYIAKLGANGEPQLWHPTDKNPDNWLYWYSDSGLSSGTARSYMSAVAYRDRMYILGGDTDSSPGGITTVEVADILPNGTLSAWSTSGMQALPSGAGTHMMGVEIYNDVMYVLGGFEGVTTSSSNLRSSVYYSRLDSDGSMNTWQTGDSFSTARSTFGGNFSYIWGAYIYISGGCTTVNGSGYCTAFAEDMQVISINSDGSLDGWHDMGISTARFGYNLVGWQGGLYRIGGCTEQDSSTGECIASLADVDFGIVNPAGEVSTVSISEPSGSGDCTGGSPFDCDLPPPGDDAGEGGQLLAMSVILNGYLYVIGGCVDYDCNGTTPASDDYDATGNTSYVAIASDGGLTKPTSCSGTSYGAWCVDSTNKINNTGNNQTDGVAAAGVTTFNNRIYIVGGLTGNGISTNIYYNSTNSDGSLSGAWSSVDTTTVGATDVAYTYSFARANPSSAGTNPGNLYILGGCGTISTGAGCGSSDYRQEVYKCNITTSGAVSGCSTSGQLQIDSTPGYGSSGDGLGIHSGTLYANYIFLIGGYSQSEADKDDVLYAKIDNSNNIVAVSGSDWIESSYKLSVGRRRGWAFGYNGHIYSLGGYDASGGGVGGIIPFIEWSKMNVSDGSIDEFITSSITINQRWGLTVAVSNAYAYVIGGCDVGAAPSSCSSFEPSVQTFQLYNNDSGSIADFTTQSDQTFTTDTDRWGASSVVYNGYLYVAGGCISATDCTDATSSVQYAAINAADGSVGTWSAGGSLPADRAWGSLEEVGGTLYYIGGQDDTATNEQSTVYYTSSISSGNPTWNGTAATNGLPAARTKFGSTVWNDRMYVVGGLDGSATSASTVYVSPKLSTGGDITSSWSSSTAFNVARSGLAVTSYANNLYIFGGYDGTNYLSDVQFASIGYKTGTISQSGTTTVTGSGTSWTTAMEGSQLLYGDGYTATIVTVSSTTSMTVDISRTVSAGSIYTIDDGSVGSWSYTKSLSGSLRNSKALSANGYVYLVGGRSATSTCKPKVLIAPISANTTIATGNNPTGVGEWYETNTRYDGGRYGVAAAYYNGKIYTMGGGCTSPLGTAYTTGTMSQSGTTVTGSGTNWTDNYIGSTITYHDATTAKIISVNSTTSLTVDTSKTVSAGNTYSITPNRHFLSSVNSQPQVAAYSRLIDTDTDVFPNSWLMNGLDNSIGARWRVSYKTMNDTDGVATDCGTADMTDWGQITDYGEVTLGDVAPYVPKDGSGNDIECARYYFFYVSIDASKTFGYPEDVNRGPTISDLSLFFTSDPSKRLRHGKTFTGGELQPLDTPCRQNEDADCPLPAP
ncbi:hypothetical protein H6798_02120 [Candidatus Nomurabacteria bacterium]|nr:hypothetical protein [Candidatus Nomurabacteria bacterium]